MKIKKELNQATETEEISLAGSESDARLVSQKKVTICKQHLMAFISLVSSVAVAVKVMSPEVNQSPRQLHTPLRPQARAQRCLGASHSEQTLIISLTAAAPPSSVSSFLDCSLVLFQPDFGFDDVC